MGVYYAIKHLKTRGYQVINKLYILHQPLYLSRGHKLSSDRWPTLNQLFHTCQWHATCVPSQNEQEWKKHLGETVSSQPSGNTLVDVLLQEAGLTKNTVFPGETSNITAGEVTHTPHEDHKDLTDEKVLSKELASLEQESAGWADTFGTISSDWGDIQKVEEQQRVDDAEIT